MVVPGCPRCTHAVALHEGRPFVTPSGAVELWHRDCFALKDSPVEDSSSEIAASPPLPARAPRRAMAIAVSASAALGLVAAHVTLGRAAPPPPALANVELATTEKPAAALTATVAEAVPPRPPHIETALEVRYPMPTLDGWNLDSVYPSLKGWIHPVTASAELMPELASRKFGSARDGVVGRPECGAGHCGIDLDGPRGRALVAVADGVIVRVEHSENGADGRSGRYVRIQHDDGTLTAYMHMDAIAPDLQPGNRVGGGQYVGTLGATAVGNTPPHCHFSLELPNQLGAKGDVRDTHYIDPAPFLVRSTIVKTPLRTHAVKPAF
ncbi:MAG: M23 family metallopeptidase [Myxococcales bacterium]|nr:M23 family metallopeptidase [Myxococcales bacterium]